MAARSPRRSFASPFVVTLAAAPACYVQSSPPPQGPPPQQPPAQTAEPQPTQPGPVVANPPHPRPASEPATPPQKPPIVIANPPPPTTQGPPAPPPTQPSKPPVVVVANPPPPQAQDAKWTVYKAKDGCMAAIKVECQPKATCNPPPPFKYACPDNVSLDKPVTVVTHDGTSCFVEFDMPSCPKGVACNPPRPRPVACPTPNR